MSYIVRNGRLIRQAKPKLIERPIERPRDPEWEAWFDIVKAKMAEMFGPEDPEWSYSYDEEKAAEAALAQEGKHPPTHPCPI